MVFSVSAYRKWSRCQRQFFLSEIMASPTAKDPLRKRAELLSRIQEISWWTGSVVHKAVEIWVLPKVRVGIWPAAQEVILNATDLAQRQFAFSQSEAYRDSKKSDAGRDYCILAPHYLGTRLSPDALSQAIETIKNSLNNLLKSTIMKDFLMGRSWYDWEWRLSFKIDGQSVQARPDLLMPFKRELGLEIVDWKVATTASDYYFQVAVYALSALASTKYAPYAKVGLKAYVVNLAEAEPEIALRDPYDVTADNIVATTNRMYEIIDDIRAVVKDDHYEQMDIGRFAYAKSAGTCTFCNWRELCMELGDGSFPQSLSDSESKPTQLTLSLD